jgi:hypothetical protein
VTASHFRPRSASELVDAAIQLARAHYQPLLVLSGIVALPGLVINLLTSQLMPSPTDPITAEWSTGLLLTLPLTLAGLCIFAVGYGALVDAAADAYVHGRTPEPAAALRRALSRAGSLIAGNMLAYLIMAGGLLAAFVGMAVVVPLITRAGGNATGYAGAALLLVLLMLASLVWFVVALPRYVNVTAVVMLEGAGPLTAVRRSRELARGSALRILGLLVILGVLFMVVVLTIGGLLGGFFENSTVAGMISSFLLVPVYPVLGTLFTALYYDLRIRREGYDIELLAQAVGDAPAGERGTQPSY